ncbi:MAG: hypothetical protein R3F50_21570 [Gammaproteobacteria bacterium]
MTLVNIPSAEGHDPEAVRKTSEVVQDLVGICHGSAVPYIRQVLETDLVTQEASRLFEIARVNLSEILENPIDLEEGEEEYLALSLRKISSLSSNAQISDEDVFHYSTEFASVLIRTWLDELLDVVSSSTKLRLDSSLIPIEEHARFKFMRSLQDSVCVYGIDGDQVLSILSGLASTLASTNLTYEIFEDLIIVFPFESADGIQAMNKNEYECFVHSKDDIAGEVAKAWLNAIHHNQRSFKQGNTLVINNYLVPNDLNLKAEFIEICERLMKNYPFLGDSWPIGIEGFENNVVYLILSNVRRSLQHVLNRDGRIVVLDQYNNQYIELHNNRVNRSTIVATVLEHRKKELPQRPDLPSYDILGCFSTAVAAVTDLQQIQSVEAPTQINYQGEM